MMHRLDLTDNERAVLITALRRLVDVDPQTLSPQIQALKAILERLEPHKVQPIPEMRAPDKPAARQSRQGPTAPKLLMTLQFPDSSV